LHRSTIKKYIAAESCGGNGSGNGNGYLVSISPTFYEQLLRQNPFAEKLQTQIVSTLKAAQKTFVRKCC
jgi:hypothetical protein